MAEVDEHCIVETGVALNATAAKLVHPQRKVVALTGDAGFMMNSQEIETALRKALQDNTVSIIDCPVEYAENMLLTRRLEAMTSPL